MKLLCVFAILSVLCLCQAAEKLKVTVFFESLCPGCRYFILNRLHPDYQELGDYLDLELVPFQWCNEYEGKWSCNCQHGSTECLGNMYDSCALANSNTNVALEFIACLEKEKVSDESLKLCAKQAGISYDDLKHCAETKALDLLVGYSQKAKQFKLNHLPTIIFNDKYDKADDEDAYLDFKKVVCKFLSENPPKACSS